MPADPRFPPGKPGLVPGTAEVWALPLRLDLRILEELRQVLSPDECQRAVRFRAPENQDLFVAGRAILRIILSHFVCEPPGKLIFGYGPHGKPYLKNHPQVHFSLAHSGGFAVYALAADDIGVDVELVKPTTEWQKISQRFFSPREAEELLKLPPGEQIRGFFACWARKEAFLKATGQGMSLRLDSFYAGADPKLTSGPIQQDEKPLEWFHKDLHLEEERAGSIATRFEHCNLTVRSFSGVEDCMRFVEGRQGPR